MHCSIDGNFLKAIQTFGRKEKKMIFAHKQIVPHDTQKKRIFFNKKKIVLKNLS